MKDTIRVKVGGKDENRIFDAVTAHYKALAEGATPEAAPPLPNLNLNRTEQEDNITIVRPAVPREWFAKANALRDTFIAQSEAAEAAKNAESKIQKLLK